MKKKHLTRPLLSFAVSLMIAAGSIVPVSASDIASGTGSVQQSIPMEGTISSLTLSVTHPITVAWSINPNHAVPFAAPDFQITNNSKVRIHVILKSLTAVTAPVTGNPDEILLTDVAANGKDWLNLNRLDSMKYIALGLQAYPQSGWDAGHRETAAYAVDISNTPLGDLAAGQNGSIGITANHGLAISNAFVAAHTLVFTFTID